MVQRTRAGGISQIGRATQGVRVMNLREDDRVSAVALVVESGGAAGSEPATGADEEPADGEPAPKAPAAG
jgi:DNA gyrase subunit A